MADVKNFVSRLFTFGRKSEAPLLVGEALAPGEEIAPPSAWDDGIQLALGNLVKDVETKASGRVQVMTLSHLRMQLGDQWAHYRPRVEIIAETTIGRMIGKGNTYIPQDEDSWLLLMPALPERDAERKADEIAAVIGEKLVGERFEEKEPPLPQTEKIDLTGALNKDGSLNLKAVKASVKRTQLLLAARDARRPVKTIDGAANGKPGLSPLEAAATAAQSRFGDLTLVYRPSWSADTHAIDTFSLRAFDASGEPLFGPHVNGAGTQINEATMIDIAKTAFADFTAMAQKGLRARFVMPLPYSMTRRKLGAVFLRAVSALPQKERLLHMRIELVGIPKNVDVDHLIDVREMFRGRVREVGMLADIANPPTALFMLDHIVVGAEVMPDGPHGEEALGDFLNDFRRRAGTRRSAVSGLRSGAEVALAVKTGFDEISGTGLADDHRHLPDRISVLQRETLL